MHEYNPVSVTMVTQGRQCLVKLSCKPKRGLFTGLWNTYHNFKTTHSARKMGS